jgi:hypothetical protein
MVPTGRKLPGKPGSDSQAPIQFPMGGTKDNGASDRVIRIEMVTGADTNCENANLAELHAAGAGEMAHRGEYGNCEPPDPVPMACGNPRSATHPRMGNRGDRLAERMAFGR